MIRNILLLFFSTLLQLNLSAQSEDISPEMIEQVKDMNEAMFSTKIELDLSWSDFVMTAPNNYMSVEKSAMISLSLMPKGISEVQTEFKDTDLNVKQKELFEINGKQALLHESRKKESDDGETYVMQLYCIENGSSDCIMVTCLFPEEHETELSAQIRNSLLSIQIK